LLEDVAEEFYEKGDLAFKEGRLQEARDLLERALTLQPGHLEAKARLASVIRALEPPEPEPVPTPQKNSKEALLKKLSAELDDAMKNKNWEKSDRVVKNILAVDPNNDRAKTKLKSIHHQLAIKAADRAVAREKAGDFQGAVDAYRVAINYFKDQAYIEKIEELTEKINEVNEKKSEELYLQALDASQNGNNGKAINLCQDALQLNPDNIQAERMLDRLQSKANP
jgi:tetratricopeptide (TPR) repeat protein